VTAQGAGRATIFDELAGVPILFGLAAQGHLPTIETMLAAGSDWNEIRRRISWDGDAARRHYERHLARTAKL
jgi:hypothetical protein